MKTFMSFSELSPNEIHVSFVPIEYLKLFIEDNPTAVCTIIKPRNKKFNPEKSTFKKESDLYFYQNIHRHKIKVEKSLGQIKLILYSGRLNACDVRYLGFEPLKDLENKENAAIMINKLKNSK